MAAAAPGAEFQFIAHLPEWTLEFPIDDTEWGGALPSVQPAEGNTVWGAVFSVPDNEAASLDAVETAEQRVASTVEAMDRTGKRHRVTVHRAPTNGNGSHRPSPDYLRLMVEGSRHWSLPVGWIAGLEEHLQSD